VNPGNPSIPFYGRTFILCFAGLLLAAAATPARGWWGYGHETITQGVLQDLGGTGDLQRFISETNAQFSMIPHIEPTGLHYIDIDYAGTTTGNAGTVSYANDFTSFRAGTFAFPTTTAAAYARYGSGYVNNNGGVPWLANDTLATLTTKMQAATTYEDWYHLLPTAGALAHYIEDMHQPMHLTKDYDGIPSSGLHANYEGGQFEDGSVRRYPELFASMTPVAPTYYGPTAGAGFITNVFNRIPTDYDKNVLIRNANTTANGAGLAGSVAYYDSLWNQTKGFTKNSFQDAAAVIGSALYTAYVNASSKPIPQATFYAAPAKEQSTITTSGPITNYFNEDYFQVGGSDRGSRYGVARFDMAAIKAKYDARYGPGQWSIDNVAFTVEANTSSQDGALALYYSADDLTNIQPGSVLRYSDGGAPLGVNFATDTPLLQYTIVPRSPFTFLRFDSHTTEAFDWTPLQQDVLSGDTVTLLLAPGTAGSSVLYYGGSGLSLEVSAHAIPEPSMLGPLAMGALVFTRRARHLCYSTARWGKSFVTSA
jgi:hypothetical protein